MSWLRKAEGVRQLSVNRAFALVDEGGVISVAVGGTRLAPNQNGPDWCPVAHADPKTGERLAERAFDLVQRLGLDPLQQLQEPQTAVAEAHERVTLIDPTAVWTEAGLGVEVADGELIFPVFEDQAHFNNDASDALGEAFIAQFDTA